MIELGDERLHLLEIHTDHDEELDITLVHRGFETGSSSQERTVRAVMAGLATTFAVEEVAAQMSRLA